MTWSRVNELRVNCNMCNNCDWVEARTHKEADKILKEHTDWEKIGRRHFCSGCQSKDEVIKLRSSQKTKGAKK